MSAGRSGGGQIAGKPVRHRQENGSQTKHPPAAGSRDDRGAKGNGSSNPASSGWSDTEGGGERGDGELKGAADQNGWSKRGEGGEHQEEEQQWHLGDRDGESGRAAMRN